MKPFFSIAAIALALTVMLVSCGRKAPPRWDAQSSLPAPSNITAHYSDGGVNITWGYAQKQFTLIDGFVIERNSETGDITSDKTDVMSYTIADSTGYSYRIKAKPKRRGASSTFSPIIKRPDVEILPPPQSLKGEMGMEGLRLSWDSVTGADAYLLYRATKGKSDKPTPVNSAPLKGTDHMDKAFTIKKGETAVYTVRAISRITQGEVTSIIQGAISNGYEISSKMLTPSAPKAIGITQGKGKVLVYWDINPEKWVTGYRVYKADREGGLHPIANTVTPAYSEAHPGHTGVGYAVSAYGESMEGPISKIVWTSTLIPQ